MSVKSKSDDNWCVICKAEGLFMGTNTSRNSIRVIIAGDHPEKFFEIRSNLTKDPGVKIMGEAADCESAMQLIQQVHPDLVILALAQPDEQGSDWQNLKKTISGSVRMVLYASEEVIPSDSKGYPGTQGHESRGV
jgi:two-component SAPR family response regulator